MIEYMDLVVEVGEMVAEGSKKQKQRATLHRGLALWCSR